MNRVIRQPDDSYRWECSIESEYHRRTGRKIFWGILIICVVIIIVFLSAEGKTGVKEDIWIPLLVIGVVLGISIPLLVLWNSAKDPHEQYLMTEEYVKSGYGRSAVYSEYKKTTGITVTKKYIEIIGKNRKNRIYIPEEDMDLVREFILERIPSDASVRYR